MRFTRFLDVLIANAMVMLFAVRAGGDGGARGLFQLAASREYDFVLTATTVVVLLWWLCRSMFNGGGGGGGASDTLPGTRASLESRYHVCKPYVRSSKEE